MNTEIEKAVEKELFALQDTKYRDFNAKLIPNVDKDVIIGVRTPVLRKYAADYNKNGDVTAYLNSLPHKYYDENNLHGFLIEKIKDYDECVAALDKFLPYVDNWATCDLMSPKVFAKNTDKLFSQIKVWLKSKDTYTIRFGVEMLMSFFLNDKYSDDVCDLVAEIRSDEYYINMMIAWFFATALAKQYDSVLPYIEKHRLDVWCHNKAIQKSVESYRITNEQKEYLKSLKIK